MKKHLAGIKGDIGSCKKVSHDVRYQMLEYVKEFELKKKAEKQRQEEMISVPSTNSDMQEDEDVQEVYSSGLPKKPVLGKRNGTNPVDITLLQELLQELNLVLKVCSKVKKG